MTAKIGRPIQGSSKKTLRLQLRLNAEEMELIDECAARIDGTRADVVNTGVKLLKKELDKK